MISLLQSIVDAIISIFQLIGNIFMSLYNLLIHIPTYVSFLTTSISFLPFHTVHGVLKARILKWFAIPFSSGPHFVRTLSRSLPRLASSFSGGGGLGRPDLGQQGSAISRQWCHLTRLGAE